MHCAGLYETQTPWLYIYYAKWTKDAGLVHQRTLDQITLWYIFFLWATLVILVAECGTFVVDFRVRRVIAVCHRSMFSRSVIG